MDLGEWKIPSSASGLRKTLFNGEPLSDARTMLADFFSILLIVVFKFLRRRSETECRASQNVDKQKHKGHGKHHHGCMVAGGIAIMPNRPWYCF